MREWVCGLVAVAALVAGAGQGRTGFTVYTSQAEFEAAVSGLTTQDFSAARVAPGASKLMTGPLTSATDNDVFSPGDIVPGLSINATGSSAEGNQLYVAGVGNSGNDVKAVYYNGSNATLALTFGPQVSAVGLTLLSLTNNNAPRAFGVDVLGSISSEYFSPDAFPTSGSGAFLGFIGTGGDQVQKISFRPSNGGLVGITSVEFKGPEPVGPVTTTPAPPALALVLSGALTFGFGAVARRLRGRHVV